MKTLCIHSNDATVRLMHNTTNALSQNLLSDIILNDFNFQQLQQKMQMGHFQLVNEIVLLKKTQYRKPGEMYKFKSQSCPEMENQVLHCFLHRDIPVDTGMADCVFPEGKSSSSAQIRIPNSNHVLSHANLYKP